MISIIIPTYNAERTIERCLISIVTQTYNGYEIIIQDGLSTDKTVAIVKEIEEKYSSVDIKVFSESDLCVYDAMNKGIQKANGKWVYFLGGDDYLLEKTVLKQISNEIIKDEEAYHFVYGNVISQRLSERYYGEFDKYKILANNICHQAIFFNKTVFELVGYYNLKYKILADYDFNLRCFFDRRVKIKHIDLNVAYFEKGGLSDTIRDEAFYKDYPDKTSFVKKFAYKALPLRKLRPYCKSNLDFLLLSLKKIFVPA